MAGLAFLARRWGTDPNALRHSLTEDQFNAYLRVEVKAQAEDRYVGAINVLMGIGAAFSKGNSKILDNYLRQLEGEAAKPARSGFESLRDKLARASGVAVRGS